MVPRFSKTYFLAAVVVVLAIWLGTGFYRVSEGEQGVVRRFGKVVKKSDAGLNYHYPWPIEQVDKVNVARIRPLEVGFRSDFRAGRRGRTSRLQTIPAESLMLTGDENIADVQLLVQYRIKDPEKFLFQLRNPIQTLRAATEVALRSKVGNTTIDDLLSGEGRGKVQDETREFLQQLMDAYKSGLLITAVKLQQVDAAEQVKDAFHEVVRAREDREKLINQARGYREDLIPKARGQAQEIIRAAEGYREERILRARGDGARFEAVLAEYRKAPRVTRERLHLETLERVLPNVEKVITGSKGGGGVLPLIPLKEFTIRQAPAEKAGRRGQ
ncbi:MAG: FtsH protease activity modulator HflK [Candidatus Methylomirabilia bacterium]